MKNTMDEKPKRRIMTAADIKTTAIAFVYMGFWIRFLAVFLDLMLVYLPIALLSYAISFFTQISTISYLINLCVVIFMIYLDGVKGGTPGKLILGLRIVNEEGKFIGMPNAFLRYIGKILSGAILGIGYLMIVWDEKKQSLHDRLAKTYVVKAEK
jgi:uncharacterized RDD family membrane protein YckC